MRNHLVSRPRSNAFDFFSDFDRLLSEVFDGSTRAELAPQERSFAPRTDIQENEDFYLVSLDLPGVAREDIHVDVEQGQLKITGERSRQEHKEDKGFRRFERSYGKFERYFQLPQKVDQDKIEATYENGVLDILIPKTEVEKPKSIPVHSGKEGGLLSRLMGSKKQESEADEAH